MIQKRVIADLLAYLPAKVLPALTPFITVPIFTRLFSPDQYGLYMLAFGVSEFLLAATCTGFAAGAIRFYTAYRRESALPTFFATAFSSVGAVVAVTTAIGAAALIALQSVIAADLYPLLWAALFMFAANAWFTTLMHILRGQERARWYTALELGYRYGMIGISLVLILVFGAGVSGLLWGQFLALLVALIPLWALTTRGTSLRAGTPRRADYRRMWGYAIPLTIGNMAYWGLRLADRYVIDAFHGSYEVGLYSVSYNIAARTIDLVVGLFLLVPGPIIMRLWEEEGRRAAEDALTTVTHFYVLLVLPAVVGLAALAVPLVDLLAENAYFRGHRAVWLVAVGSLAFGLGQLGGMGLLLAQRTGSIARNQFLATGFSLALNLIAVPRLGFMGAAISVCVASVLLAALQAAASARFVTWRWPAKTLIRGLAAAGLMGGAVAAFVRVTGGYDTTIPALNQIVILLLAVIIGVVVYGGMLWAFGELSPRRVLSLFTREGRSSAAAGDGFVTPSSVRGSR